MNKIALVTGATSGIGRSTAELFAQNNINLVICGRRADRLTELVKDLSTQVKVFPLSFDISKKEEVFNAIESLPSEFKDIDILINNAGNAHGRDPFDLASVDDWEAMIDINFKGLLYISKALMPVFVEKRSGHIINVGSVAGKEVYKNGSVYCASKHAVDAISKAMRIDLHKHNIKVSAIHPGLVETEFSLVRFKGNKEKANRVYQGYQPLHPDDVADAILFMINRPAHVNIADMLIFPSDQASANILRKDKL